MTFKLDILLIFSYLILSYSSSFDHQINHKMGKYIKAISKIMMLIPFLQKKPKK